MVAKDHGCTDVIHWNDASKSIVLLAHFICYLEGYSIQLFCQLMLQQFLSMATTDQIRVIYIIIIP